MSNSDTAGQTPFAPGARIEVRDAEWMVRTCTYTGDEASGHLVRAVGVSPYVRDEDATFFTGIEDITVLQPEYTELVADDSRAFVRSRLYLESALRRTPLPQTERRLAMTDSFLLDDKVYQQRPAELALRALRPRILVADVVGLGKTLELGHILAELIRRGRGERILVVTPQQVLEQFQEELWTRFAIPLVRLDSVGLERIQRDIPAGRNPFLYFKRAIISVDTLKNEGRYGQHLRSMHWDAVVFDESHNLINEGNLRNRLARLLADRTDALLLASATPHNGDTRSFAQLIRLLDPTAIADPENYSADDIRHLYIRRTKVNSEVRAQIGSNWPERGPSTPVRCAASPAEEAVFAELTRTWFASDAVVRPRDRLVPYGLAKSFLSSHKALVATTTNRLRTLTDAQTGAPRSGSEEEHAALERLRTLASTITDGDSAKLGALVTTLRDIGVGADNPARVVVFSESVPTLKWLGDVVPQKLGLTKDEAAVMHGGLSDTAQMEVIADFGRADSPVRLLFTGDVASEGVNLHRQCHQIVHFDVPWSLIRMEQRNGRIDRYGQENQPQFRALILTSTTEGALDDTSVAEKVLGREEEAHRTMGSAEAVVGEFTPEAEEDRLTRDLLNGRDADESFDAARASAELDPMDAFIAEMETQGESAAAPELADVPRLFESTAAFVRAALEAVAPEVEVDEDQKLLAFTPPADLAARLTPLPTSYLREHGVLDRMRVTFDKEYAEKRRRAAREATGPTTRSAGRKKTKGNQSRSTTTWPDTSYVTDLHPLTEWLVDKAQVRLHRKAAPVIVADVAEPTFLMQGVYSNAAGHPTVVEWMAVTGLPDNGEVEDLITAVHRAGIGPGMINTGDPGDLDPLRKLVEPAVRTAREYLTGVRADYDERIQRDLEEHWQRVRGWEQLRLGGIDSHHPTAAKQRDSVSATVDSQQRLIEQTRTSGEPLIRLLAVVRSAP